MQACKRFTLVLILAFFAGFFVQSMAADKILKVLTIGNSFSEDAVEQNLYELAAAKAIGWCWVICTLVVVRLNDIIIIR